jgi:hypothetical protein
MGYWLTIVNVLDVLRRVNGGREAEQTVRAMLVANNITAAICIWSLICGKHLDFHSSACWIMWKTKFKENKLQSENYVTYLDWDCSVFKTFYNVHAYITIPWRNPWILRTDVIAGSFNVTWLYNSEHFHKLSFDSSKDIFKCANIQATAKNS